MLPFQPRHTIRALSHAALVALAIVAASFAAPARAHADDATTGRLVIDVNGPTRGKYPLALPTAPDGDAAADKQVAEVMAFDMSVAGPFKVVDPTSFLADLKAEALGIDPQKWKDVGAYGVVKYAVSGSDPVSIEFRLYEVDKGNTPSLTKTYTGSRKEMRKLVHQWCNELVKYYTGEPGFFGSKIAFTARGKGTSAIYAMDFDGANAYAVSNNSSTNILPAWSRSGGQIAYTSFMRNNPDLYIAPAGGGRPKKISSQIGMNTGASWSPDGSQLAITLSKDNGNAEIYIISASDGTIVRRLTNNSAIDTGPAWSPDGSTIAFVSDRNGGPQIFTVPAAGGAATQVSFNGNYNTTPAWSPKGRVIAYTTRDGGSYDIVTLDLASKKMIRITQNSGQNEEPSFSPNGKAIAFARAGAGVFIANADGSGTAVKVWSGSATGVDWGPTP